MNYSHDSALTKRFVVKITVERCDKIKVAVSQIFDRVKSVALWSANIRKLAKDHKGCSSTATDNGTSMVQIILGLLIYLYYLEF
jgi:hypothetical protein